MLIPIHNLDPIQQARCTQNAWIALDPKTGSTLRKSPENFAPGQQKIYFLSIPNVMVRVIWAATDEDAIAIANIGMSQ